MADQPITIGTVVAIRLDSKYYGMGFDSNPADMPGVVEEARGDYYFVRWIHSDVRNSYRRHDLRYWRASMGRRKEPKPPEVWDDHAWERAHNAVIKKGTKSTANYAFVYNNGTHKVSDNTACHYAVLQCDVGMKKKVKGIVTCIKRDKEQDEKAVPKEVMVWYYNWLFNQSPWASAWRDKDAVRAYEKRTAVALTNVPANLLQGALVASRQPWEHPRVVRGAYAMAQYGIHPNLCFLLGSFLAEADRDSFVLSPHGGGHFPIECYDMGVQDAKAFINNKPHGLNGHYCEGGISTGVHDMFLRHGEGRKFEAQLRVWIDKAGKEHSTNTNPFAAAKPRTDKSVKAKDLAAVVLKEGFA